MSLRLFEIQISLVTALCRKFYLDSINWASHFNGMLKCTVQIFSSIHVVDIIFFVISLLYATIEIDDTMMPFLLTSLVMTGLMVGLFLCVTGVRIQHSWFLQLNFLSWKWLWNRWAGLTFNVYLTQPINYLTKPSN